MAPQHVAIASIDRVMADCFDAVSDIYVTTEASDLPDEVVAEVGHVMEAITHARAVCGQTEWRLRSRAAG